MISKMVISLQTDGGTTILLFYIYIFFTHQKHTNRFQPNVLDVDYIELDYVYITARAVNRHRPRDSGTIHKTTYTLQSTKNGATYTLLD